MYGNPLKMQVSEFVMVEDAPQKTDHGP